MIWRLLTFLRLVAPFSAHDVDRAGVDRALEVHSRAADRLVSSSESVKQSQGRLIETIGAARTSSEKAGRRHRDAIAELVRDMRSSR